MNLLDKIDIMLIDEASVVAGVAGSGQTRAVGQKDKEIIVLRRNPRPLKFSKLTGAYVPSDIDTEPQPGPEVQEGILFKGPLKKLKGKIEQAWKKLDVELDKRIGAITVSSANKRDAESFMEWARDNLPLKTKIHFDPNEMVVKVKV